MEEALFRITFLNTFRGIGLPKFVHFQTEDTDIQHNLSSITLKLRTKQMETGKETLLCDMSAV